MLFSVSLFIAQLILSISAFPATTPTDTGTISTPTTTATTPPETTPTTTSTSTSTLIPYPACPAGQELISKVCQTCMDGYYSVLGYKNCQLCPNINAPSGSICNKKTGASTSCSTNFFLQTSDGTCKGCAASSSSPYNNALSSCIPCSQNTLLCRSVKWISTITTSLQCIAGAGALRGVYGVTGDSCGICSYGTFSYGEFPCTSCTTPKGSICSTSTGLTNGCISGYSYDAKNTTTPCSPCEINTFALASTVTDVCHTCGPNSITCDPSTGDALTCKSQYALIAKTKAALAFCQLVCAPGLILDTSGLSCVDCTLRTNVFKRVCQIVVCIGLKKQGVIF